MTDMSEPVLLVLVGLLVGVGGLVRRRTSKIPEGTNPKIDFEPATGKSVRLTVRWPSGDRVTFTVPGEPLVPLEPDELAEPNAMSAEVSTEDRALVDRVSSFVSRAPYLPLEPEDCPTCLGDETLRCLDPYCEPEDGECHEHYVDCPTCVDPRDAAYVEAILPLEPEDLR